MRRAAERTIRATRTGARRVTGAVTATGRGVRQAGQKAGRAVKGTGRAARRALAATGRGTRRMARAAGRPVRRAGVWADRKTGRRVSTAWAAARTARTFKAARRAALAARSGARRWDAEVTASLVALVAWLTSWWRREARKAKPDTKTENTTGSDAPETASKVSGSGDPPLAGRTACPRCGATVRGVIPADEDDVWVTCPCGFKICFYRLPNDPPDNWDAPAADQAKTTATDQDRRRHPSTAPTTASKRRNRTMSTFPLAATAAEMNAAAASYAPSDMWVVARELDQLHEVPAYVALAIRTYTTRLQAEYPIDGTVVEAIHRLYQAQALLVSIAEEIGPLFRRVHADDLKREEAPRTNEPLWNV
ncbi:hypothetical protein AB0C18_12385 [Nonomuraea muscovyensis]|uniref:hypothetical protein n=1 Tax=Nonomuraea muscovyensis TaxID=1124761 RepID=UPI0034119DB0